MSLNIRFMLLPRSRRVNIYSHSEKGTETVVNGQAFYIPEEKEWMNS